MKNLDILIPVKNESKNIRELASRIHASMKSASISYRMIFVDDHSTDGTVKEIINASNKYPIKLLLKKGNPGKAQSIIEAAEESTSEYLAMIDGDLQYPPEALPEMVSLLKDNGVVVANRKKHNTSIVRKIISRTNSYLFGKLFLGLDCDPQSGLKVFRREVIEHMEKDSIKPWALDMPLLHTAKELGYKIASVDVEFAERTSGESKVNILSTSLQIVATALKLKTKRKKVYRVKGSSKDLPMLDSGVIYKGRKFITHTNLHQDESAISTFSRWQKAFLLSLLAIFISGLFLNTKATLITTVGLLSFIYFSDVIFSLYVLLKSLHFPPELKFSDEEIASLKDKDLPVYSVLVPLYKEGNVLPHFLDSISKIEWPKNKLDVVILLEEDDEDTQSAAKKLDLPSWVRVLIVPDSQPKTKPKACNYGLIHAKGEYTVVYDAEDIPDPLQLKKAYLAFQTLGEKYFCLQSKLNYFNPSHNILTRLFTAEYSLWFDVILPGLQSIESTIPLGGTSNHFRTKPLLDLHAWDPFNVTEDCDLGVRLFKKGYKTAIIDSVTLEEANSNPKNWIRQRSRWIKGYFQTYLVHMREPIKFFREQGFQALIFQLIIGMRMTFMLINPILWFMTIAYFVLYKYVGEAIESIYPAVVFYTAAFSLIVGNFMYIYNYMIGCAKREHYSLIKFVFLIPFYWIMASIAAIMAAYQLIVKPHYWEKTHHGLHIKKEKELKKNKQGDSKNGTNSRYFKLVEKYVSPNLITGAILVVATIVNNFFSFLYNAYLGRVTTSEQFGTIGLIGSLFYLTQLPTSGISRTVTFRSAYLSGKYGSPVKSYWQSFRKNVFWISIIISIVWILLTPFLMSFFKTTTPIPFLLFAPVWFIALVGSVDSGYISGNLFFLFISVVTIVESVAKFLFTYAFVKTGNSAYVYAAIPLSMLVTFIVSYYFILNSSKKDKELDIDKKDFSFPVKFFTTSIISKVAYITFLSVDVILAKIFLSPTEAGQYALLSLVGKMIFFLGSLFSQFITPLVSKAEGLGDKSHKVFNYLMLATIFSCTCGFIVFGGFGYFTLPLLFGSKINTVLPYVLSYSACMILFTIALNIVSYHQLRNHTVFPILSFFIAIAEIIAIYFFHENISVFVNVIVSISIAYLLSSAVLHLFYRQFMSIVKNTIDFLGLFKYVPQPKKNLLEGKKRILILNWRDTKHIWAGGAEMYVQEIAKKWALDGNEVTIFSGNDGRCKRHEVVDGVKIVRRGGFYTVYLWAFLYYSLRFRNQFDVIIDNENGIPFFSPLYVNKPSFLLVHHVHQEVFREHLLFPFSYIAMFIEKRIMPFVYRNSKKVTVSESSKKDLIKLGCATEENISIVSPGVDLSQFTPSKKFKNPTFIYLGRLKKYKNVDIALKAFKFVLAKIPNAVFYVVGEGDTQKSLIKLSKKLELEGNVIFTGKVTNEEKNRLLSKSWVSVQPSSFEGWGITVIEANASGTPVIASNTNGLKDSVVDGETGVLFKTKNIKELSTIMISFVRKDMYRNKLSKNARAWSKNFDWQSSADKFFSLITI